ncbi:MAG: glycoside hydrolase [Planctomycetes bacterium]|nr:glycoside hydrolase [Planctomycetota bacterium]
MFQSFFIAGFECATGYNARGAWFDQIAATHHDTHADQDYARLVEVGIHGAREAIRWPVVDRGQGRYDFASVEPFVLAADRHGVEVIWDLFHYGYPVDLDPLSDGFIAAFAEYCHACATWIAQRTQGTCYFTPVNEPSFFAWAAGHAGRFAPHLTGKGWEMKVAMARAGIAGINAIRAACPAARIVNVDPLCRVVAPRDRPDLAEAVAHFNDRAVFESWDMLAGTMMPELGGSRRHLDIVGMNYYWTNQWELTRDECPLAEDDPRRAPLRDLIRAVHVRYGGELMITETAHVDDMRPAWMLRVAEECEALLAEGVPLRAACLYPILGMPEWHEPERWTRMGLWDVADERASKCRIVHQPMLDALRQAQRLDSHAARSR